MAMSDIPLDLLRRAWPDGFLPVCGVRTRSGYQFISPSRVVHTNNAHEGGHLAHLDVLARRGDLLPSVDPADTATWACLLLDLATAAKVEPLENLCLSWQRANATEWQWVIDSRRARRNVNHVEYGFSTSITTENPALALVLARIELREKAGA